MTVDVRFVLTPFLPVHQPALGVSSLIAVLERHGFRADAAYLNVEYLDRLDPEVFDFITKFSQVTLLGEMLFAKALWGERAAAWPDYVGALKKNLGRQREQIVSTGDWKVISRSLDRISPRLERVYDENVALIERWADALAADPPRVLGFSTTFQQNVASLALACAVRRRLPAERLSIIFGGANCEDEMGRAIADNFDFVDHVVSGESEETIYDLVRFITDGGRGAGTLPPSAPLPRFISGRAVTRMDELPVPNFDDFFAARARRERFGGANLVAESARGCWWGAKAHCKFCGLNGNTMAFRSKSPGRVVEELRLLASRYGIRRFLMTDNILDAGYFKNLLPALFDEGLELFYEIKSNLRREQVLTMARAGLRWVQPGIESLDTNILRLIDKGCTKLQNIQLLKWCQEVGVRPLWSILYGFPGETPGAFEEMAELSAGLVHLPAPMQAAPFQLHRFSPYYFDAEKYGLTRVRPYWPYAFAYAGLPERERARLAYCFDFKDGAAFADRKPVKKLLAATERWIQAHRRGARLSLLDAAGEHFVFDSRFVESGETHRLTRLERSLLSHLGETRSLGWLNEAARNGSATPPQEGAPASAAEVAAALDRFRARRWIVEEGEKLLGLVNDYSWAAQANAGARPASFSLRLD